MISTDSQSPWRPTGGHSAQANRGRPRKVISTEEWKNFSTPVSKRQSPISTLSFGGAVPSCWVAISKPVWLRFHNTSFAAGTFLRSPANPYQYGVCVGGARRSLELCPSWVNHTFSASQGVQISTHLIKASVFLTLRFPSLTVGKNGPQNLDLL